MSLRSKEILRALVSKECGGVPCVLLSQYCSVHKDLEAGKLHEMTLVLS